MKGAMVAAAAAVLVVVTVLLGGCAAAGSGTASMTDAGGISGSADSGSSGSAGGSGGSGGSAGSGDSGAGVADEGTGEESGGSGAAELERLRAACGEAVTAIPDATAVPALPTDWPDAPPGAVLCTVTSSGASGTLQFVTDSAAAAVLDYYEPLLSASAPHRGDGVGGFPILNGTAGETEWAIQTGDGFYFVAVEQ